jgi:hypothetical protein
MRLYEMFFGNTSRRVVGHHLALGLLAALAAVSPAIAEERSDCAAAPPALWGDGEHDDTAALIR